MSTTKHTTIDQLKKLALRTKSEIGLVDAKVAGLTTKVNDLVTAGGEPNKLEGIKVNGTLLALTDKIADILIAEGKTNGTISANGVDVPVHGLAALAYKSEVAESDLAAALVSLQHISFRAMGAGDAHADRAAFGAPAEPPFAARAPAGRAFPRRARQLRL